MMDKKSRLEQDREFVKRLQPRYADVAFDKLVLWYNKETKDTVAIIYNGDIRAVGFSHVSPGTKTRKADQFNRKIGRKIALGRALAVMSTSRGTVRNAYKFIGQSDNNGLKQFLPMIPEEVLNW